jgi:hypothetical protein
MNTVKSFIEGQLNACLSVLSALTIGQSNILTTKQHMVINLSKRLVGLTIASLQDENKLDRGELDRIEQAIINMNIT